MMYDEKDYGTNNSHVAIGLSEMLAAHVSPCSPAEEFWRTNLSEQISH